MELSLVDIVPKPDTDGKPDSGLPVLEFPALQPAAPATKERQRVDTAPAPAPAPAPTPTAGLQLVDDSPTVSAAPAAPQEIDLVAFGTKRALAVAPEGAAESAANDPMMAEALREYQNGNIDLPLWTRAIAHHEGDQPKAVAIYLQARATALKLERRHRRVADPAPPVRAAVPGQRAVAAPRDDDDDDYLLRKSQHRAQTLRKYAIMAAPVALALVIGVWWMVAANDRDSAQASLNSASSIAAAKAAPAAAAVPKVARVTTEEDPGTYFAGKIIDLKSAGNWNVLVLFASEWTRKQPGNALAWKELSLGYTNMRQYNDALEAGTKATQLAPNDPLMWRNLAQVNLDIKEPDAALKAYERAAALDPADVYVQLQVGTLNTQLGRLPQARSAFELVLAADPENPDALCGTAAIAQRQGRGKDADAIAKQLRGTDHKCREVPSAVAVATRK
jgi:tetratricopeptide (TPR) repeat protein